MVRLHSRLLVPALLRPIGEHLAGDVSAQPGEMCLDYGCDGGVMAALLGRAARSCIAVDDDAEVVAEVREELDLLHLGTVTVLHASGNALPLRDGEAQVVTSLFALPLEPDPARTLRELLRVLDPERGRLACALWCAPATTETDDITHPLAGRRIDTAPLLATAGAGARIDTLRDVARFDGPAHYRAALGTDPPQHITALAAPDGTLRIPTATVTLSISPARW